MKGQATLFLLLAIAVHAWSWVRSSAYHSRRWRERKSLTNLEMKVDNYPTSIKDVVKRLTSNIQKALKAQESRISVELPPAVDFGVEDKSKSTKVTSSFFADRVVASNREAARLITAMFTVLSGTTVVLFSTESEATVARSTWGADFKGKTISFEGAKAALKAAKGKKVSPIMEEELSIAGKDRVIIPEGTEVLIIVGAKGKDFSNQLLYLNEELGPETLVILLNCRFGNDNAYLRRELGSKSVGETIDGVYRNVFCYTSSLGLPTDNTGGRSNQPASKEFLLFHEFDSLWSVAEKSLQTSSRSSNDNLLVQSLESTFKAVNAFLTGQSGSGFTTIWSGTKRPQSFELISIVSSPTVTKM